MKGYITNIEEAALENEFFRRVLYTDDRLQLVVMSLLPSEDIGEEVHHLDQFIRVEEGSGTAILDGERHELTDGMVVVVPAGTRHNIVNASDHEPLKLYTLYAPPNHPAGTAHRTKADAEKDEKDKEYGA
jgi:mannose-6-phosphate isomerase-like protein (cupin superfamily)